MHEFVAAFNAGNRAQLEAVFAPDPRFRWFSISEQATETGGGSVFVAFSRPVLLRHLARRQAQNERLVLRNLELAAAGGSERGFVFHLTRRADDLRRGEPVLYSGKGAVDCTSETRTILVWSMGTGGAPPPLQAGTGKGTWGALRRPVRLFRLATGSDCPRSFGRPGHELSPDFGSSLALGAGPVYPLVPTGPEDPARETARTGVVSYSDGRSEGGWFYVKVLWIMSPRYRGPALVRGRQLDGPRLVRFELGSRPAAELRLWDPSVGYTKGWLNRATYMRLRGPGCYGFQVDGKTFSKSIVFEAR